MMSIPATPGAARLNRQDISGWSFLGRKSNYQLAGPPGWLTDVVNGTATPSTLIPHPDWYTTVLWKQLMGTGILANLTVMGGSADNVSIDLGVVRQKTARTGRWCSRSSTRRARQRRSLCRPSALKAKGRAWSTP